MSSQEDSERREEGVTRDGLACHLCPIHHASLCKGTRSCGGFGDRTACSSLLSGSSCCMSHIVVCRLQHCLLSCGVAAATLQTTGLRRLGGVLCWASSPQPSLSTFLRGRSCFPSAHVCVCVFPLPTFAPWQGQLKKKRRKKTLANCGPFAVLLGT